MTILPSKKICSGIKLLLHCELCTATSILDEKYWSCNASFWNCTECVQQVWISSFSLFALFNCNATLSSDAKIRLYSVDALFARIHTILLNFNFHGGNSMKITPFPTKWRVLDKHSSAVLSIVMGTGTDFSVIQPMYWICFCFLINVYLQSKVSLLNLPIFFNHGIHSFLIHFVLYWNQLSWS